MTLEPAAVSVPDPARPRRFPRLGLRAIAAVLAGTALPAAVLVVVRGCEPVPEAGYGPIVEVTRGRSPDVPKVSFRDWHGNEGHRSGTSGQILFRLERTHQSTFLCPHGWWEMEVTPAAGDPVTVRFPPLEAKR